ncbi:hypothetical protein L7F22_009416 [Adiantum nelumboides]|nr:hypothetical protein [Adiantum nelumboides]
MHEDDETLDVTTMVTRIDSLENTMQLILNQMHELTAVHAIGKGKSVAGNPSEDLPMHDQGEPETSSQVPNVGRVRWQLKDLKPPKYNGNTAARTADAVEQWLSKWEQCFRLCNIVDDVAKIQQATYNLLDVAHRWWRKIEQDKAEPTTWKEFKVIFYNNFVPPDERSRALDAWFFLSQKHYSVQDYADKYREILLKVPEHIPDFLQVHKFVLDLKETLRPLVRKEKCSTLDKAIELAIVLEDGKKFTPGFGQKSSWTRVPRSTPQSVAALPSTSENRGKESRELHMIKTSKGKKRKVSAMAERAFNRSMLTPQQRDKAMKEGLCYGCLGKHKFKECPKRSKITANMVVNPMQEVDDSEEELLGTPEPTPHSQRILAISVTKKVSSVPDAVLSPRAQQGYQFPDTELIILKGTLNDKPVKILFDTGSTHNVISSKLVKKLKLPTRASNYSYTVELADGKGTEVWDRQVADLPFKIQSYEDRMDFEITRLARFDMVLGKQWHAWKKPTIDFSSHVIQFEHEGRRLLIRGEPDLSEAKLLRATKMLKLEFLESSLLQEIKDVQKEDPFAQTVRSRLESDLLIGDESVSSASSSRPISSPFAKFSVENGWVKRKGKIYVPCAQELRTRVLQENHDSPCAGHPGQDKTVQLVRKTFWWPHLHRDVHKYVRQCFQCQAIKAERIKTPGLLHPLQIPESNWQSISMDFIVGLPTTQRQKDTILVVVDRLSKMAHFISTKETVEAPQVADLFIQNVFRLHGMPSSIVSDRDVRFTGHFWTQIFLKLNVKLNMSSGDHPQTDGQTERVNQILEDMLRAYVSDRQTDCDTYLPLSPFEMNYGMSPSVPDTIGISKKCPSATEFLANIHRNMQVAREKLQQAADRAKFYEDKKRSARTFDEGDRVFLQVPLSSTSLSTGKCPKLSPRFCGPWTIIKKLSDVAYRLELPPGCRVHPVFHVSKLKRFISKDDNLIDGMISLQEQETTDHGPDKILDRREKRLRNRTLHDYLVAWKGLPLTDATWESEALIRKHFPLLIIEDVDLRRGREC